MSDELLDPLESVSPRDVELADRALRVLDLSTAEGRQAVLAMFLCLARHEGRRDGYREGADAVQVIQVRSWTDPLTRQ
jgi:hypothetical protein